MRTGYLNKRKTGKEKQTGRNRQTERHRQIWRDRYGETDGERQKRGRQIDRYR